MADLHELFARLNGGKSSSPQPQPPQNGYQQPSVSSPLFSPSPTGPIPHHQSAVMSPNSSAANTPVPEQGQQATNLLNLLRFNGGQTRRASSQNVPVLDALPAQGRVVSNPDLTAHLAGRRTPFHQATSAAPAVQQVPTPAFASATVENPQDLLLRLLNHPKPAQSDGPSSQASATAFATPVLSNKPETVVEDHAKDHADEEAEQVSAAPADSIANATGLPTKIFGSGERRAPDRSQPETTTITPKFTYINPFDQLEAASPRNRTPNPEPPKALAPKVEILKKQKHEPSALAVSNLNEQVHTHPPEKVNEAVNTLREQVGHQIGEVLAEAEAKSSSPLRVAEGTGVPEADTAEVQKLVADVATENKRELEGPVIAQEIGETVSNSLAAASKEAAAEVVVDGDVADNWETAEAAQSLAQGDDHSVIVYKFPMRAFASIAVDEIPHRAQFRPDLFMDIARGKKEFDQIDRSLVSASKNFIVYALVKKGGFRIIRQENGFYRQVFENNPERIFNIGLCTSGEDAQQPLESILGIGVNGTVFWTSVEPAREDQFGENLDSQSLTLPPLPSQDDHTSGGQLKTRAKPSSRHPEFFAIGRGKSIHIVFPKVAAEYARSKNRVCHTEKYFKERSLKIFTGKAGKDFTFSEDDTIIVSLDKAGRMRFWDIRALTESELGNPHSSPRQVEISETLLEFHTTTPNAKCWPTSVFFFDKDKPYTKGIALRYVMVGMKQNHTFQLWDLGLNKAVQEIHLPHRNESDAICSVAFHAKTGIMAVAHPTRNSIFFVHVSCPRYTLPVMSQAAYISRLANKSEHCNPLPPVNATAIMTSITEYSFASKSQIRSLHMLNDPAGPPDVDDPENAALFELYVMHSKGVCVLRIRRSDLGWKKEGEPINPKAAEEEGVITISQLKPPVAVTDESSTAGDPPAPKSVSDRSVLESVKKDSSNMSKQSLTPEAAMRASTLAKVESKQDAIRVAMINGSEKPDKKKKKRVVADTASQVSASPSVAASTSTARAPPSSYAQAAQVAARAKTPSPPVAPCEPQSSKPTKAADGEAPEWAKQLISKHFQPSTASSSAGSTPELDVSKLKEIMQAEIAEGFSRELDVMYKRFDEDKRVLNAANGAKQEAILRVVSSTLTDNVEGVIRKMVNENMRDILLPELVTKTSSTLEKTISNNLKSALGPQLSKEIPDAVSRALKSPQLVQPLSDQVAKKLAGSFEPMVVASVGSVVKPALCELSNSIEQQIGAQLRQAQIQRHEDAVKITQLTDTVHTCLETIRTMMTTQNDLQAQLKNLQQTFSQSTAKAPRQASPQAVSPIEQKSPERLEIDAISSLMANGDFTQGTMQWLQSGRSGELFDEVFVRWNPSYLSQMSPLLILSTGAIVSGALERNLPERLDWLETVLRSINPHDPEIRDMIPRIMDVINQRLTACYIQLNESTPGNPLLRRISGLVHIGNETARFSRS